MKLEITTEEVLELASKNSDFKTILKNKFPDCFKSENNTDDPGKNSLPIKRGDLCYVVHGTPERFTITKTKFPNCSHGAVKIFRGDARGSMNAELYVVTHTKRFTLDDIEFVVNSLALGENVFNTIIPILNGITHPDMVIHHKEDKLNCNHF
jgi:hypothetical protein